jgi:hypothetical protein
MFVLRTKAFCSHHLDVVNACTFERITLKRNDTRDMLPRSLTKVLFDSTVYYSFIRKRGKRQALFWDISEFFCWHLPNFVEGILKTWSPSLRRKHRNRSHLAKFRHHSYHIFYSDSQKIDSSCHSDSILPRFIEQIGVSSYTTVFTVLQSLFPTHFHEIIADWGTDLRHQGTSWLLIQQHAN